MTQIPDGWQDPSTDIANVNAAYRQQYQLANRYREALVWIVTVMATEKEYKAVAREALSEVGKFDPDASHS